MLDVLVIGGGPAGATAAALLAKAGWSVAISEKSAFPRDKVCGGYLGPSAWPVLEALGVQTAVAALAGPEIRRVGFFAGTATLDAEMPVARSPRTAGRAICRAELDPILLEQARRYGALVHQPCSIIGLERGSQGYSCSARHAGGEICALRARHVIAAHGSWIPGPLATQPPHEASRAGALLAFKREFREARLPADLMPLLAFRGGYGGMVHAGRGRVTLSFCIRRDALERARSRAPGMPAAEAALRHIMRECRGVREALAGAVAEEAWLAAGPIRPGVRRFHAEGAFVLGNAAAEAQPAIAEGIAMAMESAALLCQALLEWPREERRAALAYERRWRARYGRQILVSGLVARAAMHAGAIDASRRLLGLAPRLLTYCAGLTGKAS
jgi:flavin-dependent dehydrogenase